MAYWRMHGKYIDDGGYFDHEVEAATVAEAKQECADELCVDIGEIEKWIYVDEIDPPDPLITAAPDLLAALETLVKMAEDGDWTTVELEEARAAIAKARGMTANSNNEEGN